MAKQITAATSMQAVPAAKAPGRPIRVCRAAPMNGPANRPMRMVPPRVDMARARWVMGTATAR